MAKKENELVRALALSDIHGTEAKCTNIVEGSAALIKSLSAAGLVDPADEAVEAALSWRGQKVVTLGVELEQFAEAAASQAEASGGGEDSQGG